MSQKLYRQLDHVCIPYSVSPSGNGRLRTRTIEQLVLFFWPNGKPCSAVNAWLMAISRKSTGLESSKTAAVEITHLVRYCWSKAIEFGDITDADLYDLAQALRDQRKLKNGVLSKAREENQIHQVMSRSLDFIIWHDRNVRPYQVASIIGEEGSGAQITVEIAYNVRTGRPYYSHSSIPHRRETLGDKHPMPDAFITDIENQIYRRSTEEFEESNLDSLSTNKRVRLAQRYYIYERRMFMIWIMKLTGLRPEEMHRISLQLNSNVEADLCIMLPTMKKRQQPPPLRRFNINLDDAITFTRYLDARIDFLNILKDCEITVGEPPCLFLGEKGTPILKASLATDFKRLALGANLTNIKVCLSMFRHRFITQHLSYEIYREMKNDIKLMDVYPESVRDKAYLTVSKLTGTRPTSLNHYFHDAHSLALDLMRSQRDVNDMRSFNSKMETLLRLKHDVKRSDQSEIIDDIERIMDKWEKLKTKNVDI
ncbi:hypothetical protein [Pseudomonas sp. DSP3-2-2]|uniref:hypothetical protein n=1 Tax=unclassified Pseudomonas TaxID=196821 RepID=UPI003CEC65B8